MGVLDAPPGLRSRGAWAATTAYAKNDIVTYLGGVYRALASFTSAGSFNPANWEQWVPQSGTSVPALPTAPSPTVSPMWVDTSTTPPVLKSWNGSVWVTAIPGTAAAMALVFGG